MEGITIRDIDIEAGDDGQLFLHLGPEKRVGFGSPVGTKRWYFIKLARCRLLEN